MLFRQMNKSGTGILKAAVPIVRNRGRSRRTIGQTIKRVRGK